MSPTLKQLRIFVDVADCGSFTRAGTAHGISQSAVSQNILKLERLLGQKIIDRDRHHCSTTMYGKSVYEHAKRVLASYEFFSKG